MSVKKITTKKSKMAKESTKTKGLPTSVTVNISLLGSGGVAAGLWEYLRAWLGW